jgi:hypothetical protein
MTGMTLRTMTDSIAAALGNHGDDYDLDALTDDLHTRYGIVPVDDIPTSEFWETVDRHRLSEQDEPTDGERFDAEATAAIAAERALGEPAVWQRGGITVEITGASRVNAARRLVGATIQITSTTGAIATPHGLATTADLWEHVAPLLAEWEVAVRQQEGAVRRTMRAAEEARQAAEAAAWNARAAQAALRALRPDAGPTGLMSKEEVAAYLGIAAGSVPRQMSRWSIVAVPERIVSGRTESRYPAVEVVARAAGRPGRGARTDLRPSAE